MIKRFFNSMIPLLILSFATSIIAIIYAILVRNSTTCYTFYSYNEYISISSGVMTFTTKSNVFEGNKISYYAKDDISILEYDMGYYFKSEDQFIPIIEASKTYDVPTSLKAIVDSIDGFNFVEPSSGDSIRIPKKYHSLINKNMYFIIKYKTPADTEYKTIKAKLLLAKID